MDLMVKLPTARTSGRHQPARLWRELDLNREMMQRCIFLYFAPQCDSLK